MKNPNIVVVGSLHHDIMIDAPRRPRTGETVTGTRWYPKFGGKGGNQAIAARNAGAEVKMVGAVGSDGFGKFVLDRLAASGVATDRIARLDEHGTGMSVAITDPDGDYGAIIVSGANLEIDLTTLSDATLWAASDLLMLQNEIPDAVNLAAAGQARAAGVKVCLNAAPARPIPDDLAEHIDILIVNALEAEALTGLEIDHLEAAADAAARLAARFPASVVTAGAHGVAMASDGTVETLLAEPVEVISTHGAGDVFCGTFCAALGGGLTLTDALSAANKASATHVSRAGADWSSPGFADASMGSGGPGGGRACLGSRR